MPDLDTFGKICLWLNVDPRDVLGTGGAAPSSPALPKVGVHFRKDQHRRDLKLRPFDPLPAERLAQHLDVLVWRADQVPGLDSRSLSVLLKEDPDSWSAVTISGGAKDLVILNSAHRGARPASDLMHEIAHLLIGHIPARVDISPHGILMLNTYNAQQEQEATWLAGALLLPRPALMHIRQSHSPSAAITQSVDT